MFACNLDPGDLSDDDNIVTQKKQMSSYVQEFTNDGDVVIHAANSDRFKSVQDKQVFIGGYSLHNYSKSFNILLKNIIIDILQAIQWEKMCTNIFPGPIYTTAKTCFLLPRPFWIDLTSETHRKWLLKK